MELIQSNEEVVVKMKDHLQTLRDEFNSLREDLRELNNCLVKRKESGSTWKLNDEFNDIKINIAKKEVEIAKKEVEIAKKEVEIAAEKFEIEKDKATHSRLNFLESCIRGAEESLKVAQACLSGAVSVQLSMQQNAVSLLPSIINANAINAMFITPTKNINSNSTTKESTNKRRELVNWVNCLLVKNVSLSLSQENKGEIDLSKDTVGYWLDDLLSKAPLNYTPKGNFTIEQSKVFDKVNELFTSLAGRQETQVQNDVSDHFTCHFDAIDTHSHEVVYDFPFSHEEKFVKRSGKPDFMSKKNPLMLELKGSTIEKTVSAATFDVLLQSLQRAAAVVLQHQGILKRGIVFGIDGHCVFQITFHTFSTDETPLSNQLYRLSIERFTVTSFLYLWVDYQNKEKEFFYDEHREVLIQLYETINLDWRLTRSEIMRRTYRSTLFRVWVSRNGVDVSCSENKTEFILKIGPEEKKEKGEIMFNEATALEKLGFEYVLGIFHKGEYENINGNLPDVFGKIQVCNYTSNQLSLLEAIGWWMNDDKYINESNQKTYWVIIMQNCLPLDAIEIKEKYEESFWLDLLEDVRQLLLHAHSKNIVHCDIRSANIMYWRDKFRLVDWDMSRPIDSRPQPLCYGARYDARPLSLLHFRCSDELLWTPEHDLQMLYEYVIRKLMKPDLEENEKLKDTKRKMLQAIYSNRASGTKKLSLWIM